jgi:hypothetical protein
MIASRQLVAIPIVITGFLLCSCGAEVKVSPELKQFNDANSRIELGMTEKQVDGIMRSYPVSETMNQRIPGKAYTKTYDARREGTEGDYFATVYFDSNGKVIDLMISVYAK